MYRLNNSAFNILRYELLNYGSNDEIGRIERQFVTKRLKKLRKEKGSPATLDELRDAITDVFPEFSEKILKKAARANQPPGILSKLKWAAIFASSIYGAIWLVNLPFPMIRKPVAEKAPLLLLPSYISMDNSYRGAINATEQADILVNKATSIADIKRGGEKVKLAQQNLDNLPVWFLGYYPQTYCVLFRCSWKFTFDEFETAPRQVARMDAKVFQEKNAFKSLTQAESDLKLAKEQYQQTKNSTEKQKAFAQMQTAIISLEQIPGETLAGKKARTIIANSKSDLNKIITKNGKSSLSGNLIEAGKVFAMQAAQASQNPPHPVYKWEQVEKLWLQAINRLQNIEVANPNYLQAQKLLAKYQNNQGIIRGRLQAERESKQILEQAEAYPPSQVNQYKGKLQGIINKLETVKPGTTSYPRAQQLILSAQKHLKK